MPSRVSVNVPRILRESSQNGSQNIQNPMTTSKNTYSARIKSLRSKEQLSQQALADLVCVSLSTLSRWEKGTTVPNGEKAKILERWLNSGIRSWKSSAPKAAEKIHAGAPVIGLFAGCGGLDLGFHKEGFNVVWANEFNETAADTYERNFPGTIVDRRSISDVDPYSDTDIPDADLVLGGFPCQDFSIIWKRPGLDGERGNLYKDFLRVVDAKKPKAFIAENVKGLISANQKKALKQIVHDFALIEPGYLVHVKLFNFADYGVPQFRERVIITGIRIDTGFDYSFPKPTHGPKADCPYFTAGEALEGVESVAANSEHMNINARTAELLKLISEGGNFADIPKDHPLYVKGMISHVYRRIHRGEPAKTIIAAGGGGTWGYHYPEPRALTNRERARLQSFPDDFGFCGSFTEVRRQIGNAVPPQSAQRIAQSLKPLFSGKFVSVDLAEKAEQINSVPIDVRIQRDSADRQRKLDLK